MPNPLEIIAAWAVDGIRLREQFFQENAQNIFQAALLTARAFANGNKLLLCGNGGSAADCQHVAGEFVNRFLMDRPALPAIALTTDTSSLTAIANDSAFENVFARQVEALGHAGDVLLAISTSGKSPNVLQAMLQARQQDMSIIGLTGDSGLMNGKCNILLSVSCASTPLIQEIHLACEHLYCRLVDLCMFEQPQLLNTDLDS